MLVPDGLQILQNNVHKNKERTDSMLNNPDTKKYTVLLLQEPHWSEYKKSSPTHQAWMLFEPIVKDTQPRAAIYINKNLNAAQIILPFPDVVAVQITTSDPKPMLIINVYKPCDENRTESLHRCIHAHLDMHKFGTIIIAGDFNLHHPLWNPNGYPRHDDEANDLVEMMADFGMSPLVPKGTVTYPNAETAIDLVWGNDAAVSTLLKCQIAEDNDHGSDHLPIETAITTQPTIIDVQPAYNYANTNWEEFKTKLASCLPRLETPKNAADINNFAQSLTAAITHAIESSTPRKKPCPHSKRWWTLISHDYDGQPIVQGIDIGEQGTTSLGLNGGRGQMSTQTQLQRKRKLNGGSTSAMLMENPYGKLKSTSTMLRYPRSYQP